MSHIGVLAGSIGGWVTGKSISNQRCIFVRILIGQIENRAKIEQK